jgi:hypothetical protein
VHITCFWKTKQSKKSLGASIWISGDVCFIVTGGNIFVVAMIG